MEAVFGMKKIAFIGAGSFGFTRSLVRDILSFPALSDCTLALMDVDGERLRMSAMAVEKIIRAGRYPASVLATTSRAEALQGADGVLCTILSGGVDVWRHDVEIPMRYGVDYCVGDTRGPAGIFRALRTIPVMLGICRDIEKYCPDALLLNYTNPMAMLCRAMQGQSKIAVTGLCHSVQGTAHMLARWIGAPMEEVTYTCAGINHQAFYLEYKWRGKDAYPLIRQAVERPDIYALEPVRNEMFRHLDYYCSESSGHNSEYNPWFRKRPGLIEAYCSSGQGNYGRHAAILDNYLKREETWRDDIKAWLDEPETDLNRGGEYASSIFNACFGDGTVFGFNGNVRNFGLIDNLPEGCCVEVPMFAFRAGLQACHVGPLPQHLAVLVNTNARCEELAVEAAITGDPRMVFHACCMDPLASAVLSLAETKSMVNDMLEQNRPWLPQFRSFRV